MYFPVPLNKSQIGFLIQFIIIYYWIMFRIASILLYTYIEMYDSVSVYTLQHLALNIIMPIMFILTSVETLGQIVHNWPICIESWFDLLFNVRFKFAYYLIICYLQYNYGFCCCSGIVFSHSADMVLV